MSDFLTKTELQEFAALIDGYEMNEAARAEFIASNFAVITGPAGAGKDTIRSYLVEHNPEKYALVLSTTTRAPRPHESDGVEYHFRTKEEVRRGLERGEYFQSALVHHQQVSCLHILEIQKLKPSQIGLSILIVQTEIELHEIKPDIKTIFYVPPDLAELKRRMQISRGIDESEAHRRLYAAKAELEIALTKDRYYCLVNDDVAATAKLTSDFFENNERSVEQDQKARSVIRAILGELR